MNFSIALLLLVLGLLGHVTVWVAIVNRLHAVYWWRKLIDGLTMLCGVLLVALPLLVAAVFLLHREAWLVGPWDLALRAAWLLVGAFAVLFLAATARWLSLLWHPETRGNVLANHTTIVDVRKLTSEPLTAPGIPTLLASLPRNEVVCPHFHEKQIVLPRLAPQHAGLRIVHLTDLHMSGRITKRYFEEVVKRVNAWNPDLVTITGDIVEWSKCLAWIPDTIGKLESKAGVYYVLGNHDKRAGSDALRANLNAAGLVDVGSRCVEVTVGTTPIILAGNELPWYTPAASFDECPAHDEQGLPLRIALSHSPDQFQWAQDNGVDLILAGHCHGGQVRFPIVGAVLAPSIHGTRYTAGTFRQDNTIMHVSRGTSGLAPFRWNCPPEVTLLELCGVGE